MVIIYSSLMVQHTGRYYAHDPTTPLKGQAGNSVSCFPVSSTRPLIWEESSRTLITTYFSRLTLAD